MVTSYLDSSPWLLFGLLTHEKDNNINLFIVFSFDYFIN